MRGLVKGDKVRRIDNSWRDAVLGNIYTFDRWAISNDYIYLKELNGSYYIKKFELVRDIYPKVILDDSLFELD